MAIRRMKRTTEQPSPDQHIEEVYFEDEEDAGDTPGPATTSTAGLVKQATAVADVAATDAANAAGETPTQAEFNAVVAELNEAKAKLNSLLAAGRTAGWLAQ